MLAGIRKRLARRHFEIKDGEDDDKEDTHTYTPPANFIKISQGKIQLVHQSRSLESDAITTTLSGNDAQIKKDKAVVESRIHELEAALRNLQEKVNNSQSVSPTFEKELREQLENMNRVMKSKERKQQQTCRDHKVLQTRFARQESVLNALQQENKTLLLRIRQYEHCLDDVMRKVVDAIVAEDNLREEVTILKSRVRDLEEQNAALTGSPAKGRDEGYCTMSSGQPQPSNGHLEDLPEEPEQWLLPAESCSTEMEDWSMSQEELAVMTLDEEREYVQHQQQQQQQQQHQYRLHHQQQQQLQRNLHQKCNGQHDWIWNSNDFLNSTANESDAVSDGISQLLQQKIVYSEDEEIARTEFTNDFYKLVNIRSNSARSLYSYVEGETDDEDDGDDDSSLSSNQVRLRNGGGRKHSPSPTPSEAGLALVTSCSSSESDELPDCITTTHQEMHKVEEQNEDKTRDSLSRRTKESRFNFPKNTSIVTAENVQQRKQPQPINETQCIEEIIKSELKRPPPLIKSKSTLDEDEPGCILRNNQRREIESGVVRSGSANGGISANITAVALNLNEMKLQERILQRPANSWRKSNGWKRVTSPTQINPASVSTKKLTKSESKTFQFPVQKLPPTRIPTCKTTISPPSPPLQHSKTNKLTTSASASTSTSASATKKLQQQQQHQQTKIRQSKIPPPVPVRRSYAS